MTADTRPLILSCPLPRTLPLIFAPDRLAELHARYRIVETTDGDLPDLPDDILGQARYIIGQPPLSEATLARLSPAQAQIVAFLDKLGELRSLTPLAAATCRQMDGLYGLDASTNCEV